MKNYDSPTIRVTRDSGRTIAPEAAATGDGLAGRWWDATRLGAELRGSDHAGPCAAAPLAALADALRGARRWEDHVMRAGWELGTVAHGHRVPLHFVLEDLDLLARLQLDDAGRALPPDAGAAEALGAARRLHDAASLLRLAAVKGYTHAVSDELRKRYRTIRHDLRNPLGTIKQALALMEDETMPAEMREGPRFRQLARKNASSLESLIRTTLADSTALLPAFAHEPVSLRAVAAAVLRDLRETAEARGVRLVVGDRLPTVRTDSAGFDLTLKSVVLAVLRACARHAEVVIDLASMGEKVATVSVSVLPAERGGATLDGDDLSFARELAGRAGGRVTHRGGRVCVEVPISALSGGGEQPHDVRGPRERDHR